METNDIANTIDFHRAHPEVTLKEHVLKKRMQLGEEVASKYKIYLDLRFWILFRDVELGRNKNPDLTRLLSQIKHLVDDGMAICPISESVFVELMKQKDTETRFSTAKLIDHLSKGATLIAFPERVNQELFNAIYLLAGSIDIPPLDITVWTKLSSIFGEVHPYQPSLNLSEQLVIQKSFYDHMWGIPLIEMIGYFNFESWPQPDWEKTATRLNASNKQYANEMRSYKKTYRAEFEGGLISFKEEVFRLFKNIQPTGYKNFEEISKSLSENDRFKNFSKSIRTLHIGACCHAAVRWDQKRQLLGNDLIDFHHAEAAIGYCNLFLTENPLKTLVSQNHLGLMRDFPCEVESTASGGLKVLNDVMDGLSSCF